MMKVFNYKKIITLLGFVFSLTLNAQNEANAYLINITTGAFVPAESKEADFQPVSKNEFDGKCFRLLQFHQIPSDAQRKIWETQGLFLTDYLPNKTYFAVMEQQFPLQQMKQYVRAVLEIDKRFKVESGLFFNGIPAHALENGQAKLTISYYKGLNINKIQEDLKAKGVSVTRVLENDNTIDITIETERMEELIAMPYVQFIGAQPDEFSLEDFEYRNTTARANYLNSGYNGLNYNGQGITVAIGEGGVFNTHLDIKGRVTEMGSSTSTHKLEVMQNCGGAGNIDPSNRNNAWGATLISAASSPDYTSLFDNQNALYTNHSYGSSGPSSGYDATARAHDLRIASRPNHMVVYSCGNSGGSNGVGSYNFPTWATITGAMKMSKNMLAIGALSPSDVLTGFSSRGPMYDGRIIPQVVIEGSGGTSFAAPKTVGILAMLAQVYKAKNGGVVPPSTLQRAILLNTADDMGNPGPDFKHGYGRINVRRAYKVMDQNLFLSGTVSNAATQIHNIVVPAGTKQVRAMIVWPDAAAATNAAQGIVNNLNLVVKDPNNVAYLPWVLDSSLPSSEAKLNTPAVRGIDALNTIEQVSIDNPPVGNWTVEVNGFNVPSGPQTYFLTYEFLTDEIQFMGPLKDQRLQSGDTYNLRWDSYGDVGTFVLEYQLNGGNWINIVNNYDPTSRTYAWVAPQLLGIHEIKFRVKRGNLVSESDINYIGAVPENFLINKVCADVVTLKWSSVAGATAYKVYRLGAQYMEEVTSNIVFNGASAVLTGQSTTSSEYYAVSAVTGVFEGKKTMLLEKVAGDFACTGIDWTGAVSTDWFTAGNWSTNIVPTATVNVNIPAAPVNQPLIENIGAVCNNITLQNGASLTMSSATSYTFSLSGDWINNGTFNRGIGTVDFVGTNNVQEITGASTSSFYKLIVTKGAVGRVVEAISLITLNAPADPLVINSGTFKLSSASTITPFTAVADLNSLKGLWNNGGTINYGSISWFLNAGVLRLSAGTINMGTSSGNTITYLNNGKLQIEGGVLNIAGRFSPNSATSSATYIQTGGTVTVNTVGSTSTTRGVFELTPNASFSMTGGSLRVQRSSSNSTADLILLSTNHNVTGGTIQIGTAATPSNQTIRTNSSVPIYNFTVNNSNNPNAQLVSSVLTVKNNLTILGGTLNANGQSINIGGNWTNNGNFTAGAGSVTFNGFAPQNLVGTAATTFNNLTLNNGLGLTLSGNINTNVNGILNFTSGVITTGNNRMTMGSAGSVARTSGHVFGNFQKNITVGTNKVVSFEIGDASSANYTPADLTFSTVATSGNLTASTVAADHIFIANSELKSAKSINRNWIFTNNGVVFTDYNATFNFLANDLDVAANWNNLSCAKFNTPNWTYPNMGTRTATSTQITNVTSFSDFQLAEKSLQVALKVFLQGPFTPSSSMMNADLTTILPTTEPYDAMGFVKTGGIGIETVNPSVLAVTGNNAIVDWVFVELRDATNTVVYTRSALLQSDGDVVDVDGISFVEFPNTTSGNYYIAVKHRNHLGCRTANTVALSSPPVLRNFTDNSIALNGITPTTLVATNTYAMVSGDGNKDGSIDSVDSALWEAQNGSFDTYLNNTDYNLDASVDALDSAIWELQNGKYEELD